MKNRRTLSEPGSSPRMRGTRRAHHLGRHRRAVHPRACGEHARAKHPGSCRSGSSPRMRGTLRIGYDSTVQNRFIPAHAGNTRLNSHGSGQVTVHPRACGEHNESDTVSTSAGGSSPRMRGTLVFAGRPSMTSRFIPAHAGNTPTRCACDP